MKSNPHCNVSRPTRVALLAAWIGAQTLTGVDGLAAVSLISQTRTLDASAKATSGAVVVGPFVESAASPGFGDFNEAIEPLAVAISGGLVSVAQGVAKQNSVLGLSSFTAQGEASLSITLVPPAAGLSGEAGSESFFEVFFSIDEPSQFSISGFVDTQGIMTGGSGAPTLDNEVALVRTDDNTLIFTSGSNDGNFLADGPLAPGNYHLWAIAEVGASQVSSPTFSRSVAGISEFEFRMLIAGIPETSTYLSALGLLGMAAVVGRRCFSR